MVSGGVGGVSVFAVVVVAAGAGSRLGYGVPKAKVSVCGKPLLRWALEGVDAAAVAARLVVTVPEGDTVLSSMCGEFEALAVTGGATRAESVAVALASIRDAPVRCGFGSGEPSAVLIHDAARCFTPVAVFARVAEAVESGQLAVVPVVPVVDTIKSVGAGGYVEATVPRERLQAVQTPQGFDRASLCGAYREASRRDLLGTVTDDAMLAETVGIPVKTVEGAAQSFKITTPLDLAMARAVCGAGADGGEGN